MEAESDDTPLPPPPPPLSEQQQRSRSICGGCDRPIPVCLCHVIPAPPIPTSTQIIIIQHPHESHHRLNTTPLLTKSLLNTTTLVTRRLNPDLLPTLLSDDRSPASTFYLFPTSPSTLLSNLKESLTRHPNDSPPVLIVFDATWKHAREMVRASEGYLGKFATRVTLDGFDEGAEGGTIYDSELVLRKEPRGGCVSTAEAVARWLGAMEDNGPDIEGRLVRVLREMVRLQAQFLKPIKPRTKLVKQKHKNN